MNKFHVQSGKFKKVIMAADANAAALWLINTVIESFYPGQMETGFDFDPFEMLEKGPLLLGEKVIVEQTGFDQRNPSSFDTVDLLMEWNELLLAVSRMENLLTTKGKIPHELELCSAT